MGAARQPGLPGPHCRVHAETQREGGEEEGGQEESGQRDHRRLRGAREQEEERGGEQKGISTPNKTPDLLTNAS